MEKFDKDWQESYLDYFEYMQENLSKMPYPRHPITRLNRSLKESGLECLVIEGS